MSRYNFCPLLLPIIDPFFLSLAVPLSHSTIVRPCLAAPRMRTLPVIAHSSIPFRTELVPTRGMNIKNIVLAEVRGSISGCWSISKIFPLQKERYFTEGWSLVLLSSPTLEHQIVDVFGGGGRSRKIVETTSVFFAILLRIDCVVAVGGVMQLSQTLHYFLVR